MSVNSHYETVTANDGGTFEAFCALPESGRGPGVLVFQEIFGINDNMRDLATRLAEAGYVALVPDMFWRIEPRFERKDESGMADAFAMVQQLDSVKAVEDIAATHAHLLGMDECTGTIGAVGFCLGGGLTFATAAHSRVDGKPIDAAVAYYGSAINDMLGDVDKITCPIMFHYGNNDPFIPPENIDAVEKAVAPLPNATFHRYDAGHAFSNNDAPSMYDQEAAAQAWDRTLAFFAEHL
jgi:carboxymethylenebutenolidase